MAEKQHSLTYCNNTLTINGITQVISISSKEAELKLEKNTLFVKGSGLNVSRLDKEQGVVVLETQSISSLTYRQSGFSVKGLFR